ncbi:hypothetical protein PCL_02365 [Purpureocillium lilacinum]|uniref:Uncharacterized protein n=1 Tax=Purpureocillium lilacinum TaxID=33203 RepID=A0A2U3E0F1_PURLI|nr:hypothetical protein PCL_02365 [Purpureocillium lilacinum]
MLNGTRVLANGRANGDRRDGGDEEGLAPRYATGTAGGIHLDGPGRSLAGGGVVAARQEAVQRREGSGDSGAIRGPGRRPRFLLGGPRPWPSRATTSSPLFGAIDAEQTRWLVEFTALLQLLQRRQKEGMAKVPQPQPMLRTRAATTAQADDERLAVSGCSERGGGGRGRTLSVLHPRGLLGSFQRHGGPTPSLERSWLRRPRHPGCRCCARAHLDGGGAAAALVVVAAVVPSEVELRRKREGGGPKPPQRLARAGQGSSFHRGPAIKAAVALVLFGPSPTVARSTAH